MKKIEQKHRDDTWDYLHKNNMDKYKKALEDIKEQIEYINNNENLDEVWSHIDQIECILWEVL